MVQSVKVLVVALGCSALFSMAMQVSAQTGIPGIVVLQFNSKPIPTGHWSLLKISPVVKEGFKVAKRPSPKITLMPNPEFEIDGELDLVEPSKGDDTEYFNGFRPLSLKITPAKTTKPGRYSIEGRFVYFYCAEKESYCSRSVEKVKVPITVIERIKEVSEK